MKNYENEDRYNQYSSGNIQKCKVADEKKTSAKDLNNLNYTC